MAKFKIGTRVKIMKGTWKGECGVIDEIVRESDAPNGIEARYNVAVLGHPYGIWVNESLLSKRCMPRIPKRSLGKYIDHKYNRQEQILTFECASRLGECVKIPGRPDLPGLIIAVGSHERSVPHFHVFRSEEDWINWSNGASLFFTENKYFDHKNNSNELTQEELDAVVGKLRSCTSRFCYWEFMIDLWNVNNDESELVNTDTLIPLYNSETITHYEDLM